MPDVRYAIERRGCAEFRAFKILMPTFNEPGFYRQGISLSCFRTRELRRAFPQNRATKNTEENPAIYYSISFEEDMDFRYKFTREAIQRENPDGEWLDLGPDFLPVGIHAIPLTTVNGAFEFYEAIGYDYKKQKWLPTSQVQLFKTDFYRANAIMMEQQARKTNRIAPSKEPK